METLQGRVLGLVGFGSIGKATAQLCVQHGAAVVLMDLDADGGGR